MLFHQAIQIYSTLGMTSIDDLVNNIFSVFDRSNKNETIFSTINFKYFCFRLKVGDQVYPRPLKCLQFLAFLDKNFN